MKQFTAKILGNTSLCGDFYELEFTWDKSAPVPQPGRFFTVRISDDTVPLLRRPFAFSSFDAERATASMMYQKRGRGTDLLSGKEAGCMIDVVGPLGRPFPMPPAGKKTLLVAGGVGVGPMVFLAETLRGRNIPMTMVFGCRTGALVPLRGPFTALRAVICTDDGSAGFKGTTGDYLKTIEHTVDSDTIIYACGPAPMLKTCHEIAFRRNCACYVSVEQVMACGVGACMGCAVKAAGGGYKRACSEGPVFESRELEWKENS